MSDATVFSDTLSSGASACGLDLDPRTRDGLVEHYRLLLKWAPRVNLTTILEPERAALLHGVDSLTFDRALPHATRIVDVGSGAGFPGIALALRRPEARVVAVEPIRKRCSFLRVVASALDLANFEVHEGRLEDVHETYDGAVSRATWAPPAWIEVGARLVAASGVLATSGGRGAPSSEALAAVAAASGLQWRERLRFVLPNVNAERSLDVFVRG